MSTGQGTGHSVSRKNHRTPTGPTGPIDPEPLLKSTGQGTGPTGHPRAPDRTPSSREGVRSPSPAIETEGPIEAALNHLEQAFGPLEYVDPDDYARRLNPGELGPLAPEDRF
jgi:hypothetical protein